MPVPLSKERSLSGDHDPCIVEIAQFLLSDKHRKRDSPYSSFLLKVYLYKWDTWLANNGNMWFPLYGIWMDGGKHTLRLLLLVVVVKLNRFTNMFRNQTHNFVLTSAHRYISPPPPSVLLSNVINPPQTMESIITRVINMIVIESMCYAMSSRT